MCIPLYPLFCVNFWMILRVPNSGYPRKLDKIAAWPNQRCSKNLGNEYDPIRQSTTGTGQNWRHIRSTSFFCESSSGPLFEPPCFVFCRNCARPHHAWKITPRLYDAGFHCIIHTPCGCFQKRNVNPWVFPWSMTTYMGCLGFALEKRWGPLGLQEPTPHQSRSNLWSILVRSSSHLGWQIMWLIWGSGWAEGGFLLFQTDQVTTGRKSEDVEVKMHRNRLTYMATDQYL